MKMFVFISFKIKNLYKRIIIQKKYVKINPILNKSNKRFIINLFVKKLKL